MKYQPHQKIPRDELPDGADYRLANSFENFLYMVWRELGFDAPTPNQYAIARQLQFGQRDKQIIAFRGAAKSYITVPFCVWCLYRDKDTQVLTTSATGGFASDNARFAWTLIQSFDFLSHMRPTSDQARSATDFDVRSAKPAKGTSFAARGITGQITGLRADIIVSDDAETPNTSSTPGAREELRRRTGEFTAIGKPGHLKIFLGTPQCEETIYRENELKGFTTFIVPILYPSEEDIIRYGEHRLAPHILEDVRANPALAGTSTEPDRFSEGDIERIRIQWGRSEFDRQFLMFMDAGAGENTPLKLRDLIVMPLTPYGKHDSGSGVPEVLTKPVITDDPIDIPGLGIQIDSLSQDSKLFAPKETSRYGNPDAVVMHIDPSGSGTDETSWAITAGKSSRVFLLHIGSDLEGFSEKVMDKICADIKKWGVQMAFVEDNFGGGMFASLLRSRLQFHKIKTCSVEDERVSKAFKEARIISILEPLTSSRRLVVNLDIFAEDFERARAYDNIEETKRRFYRFSYQYTRMEKVRDCLPHDDRLDAVASSCKYWADRLEETEKAAEDRNFEEAMALEIQKMNDLRMAQGLPLLDTEANGGDIDKAIMRVKAQLGFKMGRQSSDYKKKKRRW